MANIRSPIGSLSLAIGLAACSAAWTACGAGEVDAEDPPGTDEALGMVSAAPTCSSSGFSSVTNCRNAALPPSPSIRRRFVRPRTSYGQDLSETDAGRTKPYSGRARTTASQTFVLPDHRTSVDGRLATVGTGLALFSPENLDDGLQTIADPARRVLSHQSNLYYNLRIDPRPGHSRIPQSAMTHASEPVNTGVFWEMCNGSSPKGDQQSRACRSRAREADPYEDGDCYDTSFVWGNFVEYTKAPGLASTWELRSIDTTVFVPRGKRVPTSTLPAWQDGTMRIYPRSFVAGLTDLPAYEQLDVPADAWLHKADGSVDYSFTSFVHAWSTHCVGANQPGYCRFVDEQRALAPNEKFRFYTGQNQSHEWDGVGGGSKERFHGFLEPASTSDGRVMFVHDFGQGIVYSYNKIGPCDARGFREWKPISMAYLDPDVNGKYGFAKYPIRDSRGVTYQPGQTVVGAYPWVDRKGNNLMFPAGDGQDGWVGKWAKNHDEATFALDGQEVKGDEVNRANSLGVVVVGAWTRGKMIVVDNGLNGSDWTFNKGELTNHSFKVPLYRNGNDVEDVPIRPAGTALLNSLENSQNFYNAMNPISPFDVVWVASSTQERNTEIVFDEYLKTGMRIIAHMNAPLRAFPTGRAEFPFAYSYANGFQPSDINADVKHWRFNTSPELQNSATGDSVPTLELRGGAWIPPIAEGGVQGRGVHLDGVNDHILVRALPAKLSSFYLAIWLDLRSAGERTLYRFGDGTEVRVQPGQLRFVAPSGASVTQDLPAAASVQGRYFHLGLAFKRDAQTSVKVFLDGTPIGTVTMDKGAAFVAPPMVTNETGSCPSNVPNYRWYCSSTNLKVFCNNGQVLTTSNCSYSGQVCRSESSGQASCVDPSPPEGGTLTVGMDRAGAAPIAAYVDELRLMDLSSGEAETPTFAEHACNLALGSLRQVPGAPSPVCDQISFRHDEPADVDGVGTGLDFPLEAYTEPSCGSAVHRNVPGSSGCVRGGQLGLSDKQLVPSEPRPDFSTVSFCNSCHVSESDPIVGLRPSKLLAGTVPARQDERRQPMSWFRKMTGHVPTLDGAPLAPFTDTWNFELDDLILGATATSSPTRLGPF